MLVYCTLFTEMHRVTSRPALEGPLGVPGGFGPPGDLRREFGVTAGRAVRPNRGLSNAMGSPVRPSEAVVMGDCFRSLRKYRPRGSGEKAYRGRRVRKQKRTSSISLTTPPAWPAADPPPLAQGRHWHCQLLAAQPGRSFDKLRMTERDSPKQHRKSRSTDRLFLIYPFFR